MEDQCVQQGTGAAATGLPKGSRGMKHPPLKPWLLTWEGALPTAKAFLLFRPSRGKL